MQAGIYSGRLVIQRVKPVSADGWVQTSLGRHTLHLMGSRVAKSILDLWVKGAH